MKRLISFVMLVVIGSCGSSSNETKQLQARLDSLQTIVNTSYKPDLGTFMTDMQMHHAQLWFAGTNNNWELANWELQEIEEATDNIRKFNKNRPESKSISIIDPAIDSLKSAIKQHNRISFTKNYALLTNSCNSCHKANAHGFNVITIPSGKPESN